MIAAGKSSGRRDSFHKGAATVVTSRAPLVEQPPQQRFQGVVQIQDPQLRKEQQEEKKKQRAKEKESLLEKFVYPLGFTFPGPRQFTFYLLSKIQDLSG